MNTFAHLGFVNALRREAGDVSALLAPADLAAAVGSCPGWQVRDLVGHLGGVHRWVTEIVRTGERAEMRQAPADDELPTWFDDGANTLAETLAEADPASRCWTFAPPHDVDFWSRRQAQETMIHRWDLATATGKPADLDPALATDGIDEAVTVLFPRQVRLARQPPLTDTVGVVDIGSGRRWVLAGDGTTSNHQTTDTDATLTGSAAELLLLLWKRVDLAGTAAQVDGNADTVRRVLGGRLVP